MTVMLLYRHDARLSPPLFQESLSAVEAEDAAGRRRSGGDRASYAGALAGCPAPIGDAARLDSALYTLPQRAGAAPAAPMRNIMNRHPKPWPFWLACLTLFVAGCGPITATSLLKQGAMWAGKQIITKEIRKHVEHKHQAHADRRRHAQPEAAPPASQDGESASSAPAE
jgi:hypothetical protein